MKYLIFLLLGVYSLLKSLKRALFLPLGAVFLAVSAYGYTAERMVAGALLKCLSSSSTYCLKGFQ